MATKFLCGVGGARRVPRVSKQVDALLGTGIGLLERLDSSVDGTTVMDDCGGVVEAKAKGLGAMVGKARKGEEELL